MRVPARARDVEEVVEEHVDEETSAYDSEEDEEQFAPRPNPFAGIKIEVATEVHEDQPEVQDEEEALSVYDSEEDEDPFNNMMMFSQALRNAGDNRPSATADDEDIDAAVFFGDADEIREL